MFDEIKKFSISEESFQMYVDLISKNFVKYTTKHEFKQYKKQENLEGRYVEKHHILPRGLGGTDSLDNLVWLSAKDHYLAHYWLFLFTEHPKMCFAFNQMHRVSVDIEDVVDFSEGYSKFRMALSENLSKMQKEKTKNRTPDEKKRISEIFSKLGKGFLVVRRIKDGERLRIKKEDFDPTYFMKAMKDPDKKITHRVTTNNLNKTHNGKHIKEVYNITFYKREELTQEICDEILKTHKWL